MHTTATRAPRTIAPLVILLGSIIAIAPMSIDMYLPAFPELTEVFDTDEQMVQLSLTAFLVGLAVGQVVVGPLSDAIGRRRPLIVGMVAYAGASVWCASAPTIETLQVGRVLQGLAGSVGAVLVMAVVRDLFDGVMVARVMSRLILVMGAAPVFAPALGGSLLGVVGWRGLFWVLTGLGLTMAVVVATFLRETLPAERRNPLGMRATLAGYRRVLSDGRYLGFVSLSVCGFLLIFGYVSGAAFAYQDLHGVSPQIFGILFGTNAIGMVIASQLNARLVLRASPLSILTRVAPVTVVAALALVFTTVTGAFGLVGLAVPLLVMMTTIGLILPNSGASALNRHPANAGSAAALLGMSQFLIGSLAGPVIGAFGGGTAVPMATVMLAGATGIAVIARVLTARAPVQ